VTGSEREVKTMRKATLLLVIGAIVVTAVVAPIAQGTGRVDRVAALERNMKALQARVGALESQAAAAKNDAATTKADLAAVQASVSTLQSGASTIQSSVSTLQSSVGTLTTCLRYKVLPLTQYGGYLYTNDGVHAFRTTAIDVTGQGQSTDAYAAVVNPSCVGTSAVIRIASQTQRLVESIHTR
jgi:hypothetical protein